MEIVFFLFFSYQGQKTFHPRERNLSVPGTENFLSQGQNIFHPRDPGTEFFPSQGQKSFHSRAESA